MTRPHQELRPSQFVITYGPGSILETRSGPVVIKSMDELFRAIGADPQDFEILDERLSRAELSGARIARVPSNDELGRPTDEPIYPTERFPFWALCTRHGREQILYSAATGCSRCPPMDRRRMRAKAGREAIRFVLACEGGHLDEVNWHRLVHAQGTRCQTDHYVWRGGGRALRHVAIVCPKCGSSENLGRAYGRTWACTGRLPETGPRPRQPICGREARIFQRGAANLHLPVVQSALTILDMPARIHHILKDRRLLGAASVLRRRGWLERDDFLQEMKHLGLPDAAMGVLQATPWEEVRAALDQLLDQEAGIHHVLRDEEFDRLLRAAVEGAPPAPPTQPGAPPLFEVRRTDVRRASCPGSSRTFRVTPVSRLRMVMVQTGYQRVDPPAADVIPVAFGWSGQSWYPGIELFGEGVFLDLEHEAQLALTGPRVQEWRRRHGRSGDMAEHPIHVWWHSLSHRLLRALSLDSGYSSTAIRERTYLSIDQDGRARGGLLLYTVQPGGDGTLGGLIALTRQFDRILGAALSDIEVCSNDPLCQEAPSAGAEGAACYSCLLASETSCEHRNLRLDRAVLLDNMP